MVFSHAKAQIFAACSGHCPPKWISIVDFFSHLVSPGSEMCHFYQTMELQSCDTPNSACKPGYTCCASTCLNKIVVCDPWYPHKVPDHICLPKDVSSKNFYFALVLLMDTIFENYFCFSKFWAKRPSKALLFAYLTHLSLASLLWDISKQNSPRCDAAEHGVPSGAILFA